MKTWGKWKRTQILIVGILFFSILGMSCGKKKAEGLFRVAGYPVTEAQMEFYRQDNRASVYSYFQSHYGADGNGDEFWSTNFEGEIPEKILEERARKDAAYDVAVRAEARKLGIDTPVLWDEIEAVAGTQYDRQMEYLSKTGSALERQIKDQLLAQEEPETKELEELYEQTDPSYFDKGFEASVDLYLYVGMKVGTFPEKLDLACERLKEALEQGAQPQEAMKQVMDETGIQLEYSQVKLNTKQTQKDNEQERWLISLCENAGLGILGPAEYQNVKGMLNVTEYTDNGQWTLEESKTILTKMWVNQRYDQEIQTLAEDIS